MNRTHRRTVAGPRLGGLTILVLMLTWPGERLVARTLEQQSETEG